MNNRRAHPAAAHDGLGLVGIHIKHAIATIHYACPILLGHMCRYVKNENKKKQKNKKKKTKKKHLKKRNIYLSPAKFPRSWIWSSFNDANSC